MNVRDITSAPSKQAQATCQKRRTRSAAVYAHGGLEQGDRLLTMPEVERMTSARKSWIYDRISRGLFPRAIRLCTSRRVAWSEKAIQGWIAAQMASASPSTATSTTPANTPHTQPAAE